MPDDESDLPLYFFLSFESKEGFPPNFLSLLTPLSEKDSPSRFL